MEQIVANNGMVNMKAMKIVTLLIWMILFLYLSNIMGIDKSIYFFLIGFPIALAGIFLIQYLFDK